MARKFNRIDVHHHLSPPGYIAELGPNQRLTPQTLAWTPEKAIEQMEKGGVDLAITSITTPGIWFGDLAETRRVARRENEYGARIAADSKGRLKLRNRESFPPVRYNCCEQQCARPGSLSRRPGRAHASGFLSRASLVPPPGLVRRRFFFVGQERDCAVCRSEPSVATPSTQMRNNRA